MILYGKDVADKIEEKLKQKVDSLENKPCLMVIQVGDNHASSVYVRNKEKACERIGIKSKIIKLNDDISEKQLLGMIKQVNEDDKIHGLIVQLPLPEHINVTKVLNAIDPMKDVDGFNPLNVGKMLVGEDTLLPCTPHGVMQILKHNNIELEGKNVVVVGASNIVGKPVGIMLKNEGATVTICDIHTKDLKAHTKEADILVVAVGKVNLITADMVKDGAVVIDVGINRNDEGKLCGDVDFANVKEKVSAITPVPKGVGVMTVTMLMYNTVKAYELQNN